MSEPNRRWTYARRFLLEAYQDVVSPPGRGIPHAYTVADILLDYGNGPLTQLAGLLHDVVEDTPRTDGDVRLAFGDEVANMVEVLTEDRRIELAAARKQALRRRIAAAGSAVIEVALADKIATLRYAALTGTPVSHQRIAHFRATLDLARTAGVTDGLSRELEHLLA